MTTSRTQTVFSPWLTPVRVASTANIAGTYYNGPNNNGVGATYTIAASSLTIDSVVCAVGDRVLLQTQTATYTQGIYVVTSIDSSVVLTRSADQQSIEQIHTGQYVSVRAGTLLAGSMFTIIEPRPQVLGVDPIVYSIDPSSISAVTFSGGDSAANALAVFSNTSGDIKAADGTSTLAFPLVLPSITSNRILTGVTPVPMVDPQSCTIQAVAGATNTCIIAIQMKDGSNANIAHSVPYKVYASQQADGLLLASPASTGFSTGGTGITLANGTAVTTQISGVSDGNGLVTLFLTDTAKQTSWIVLALEGGIKISARLTAGSYG